MADSASPNFCINCRWIATNGSRDASRFLCMAPQNKTAEPNLVTGATQFTVPLCAVQREINSAQHCGQAGLWFEPKPELPALPGVINDPPNLKPKSRTIDDLLSELK